MKQPVCNLCASSDNRVYFVREGYKVYKCLKCGLVFMHPLPRNMDYESEEYKSEGRNPVWEEKCKKRIQLIKRYKDSGSLLDIGCSGGSFLEYAQSTGYAVSGVEPHRPSAEKARKLLPKAQIFNSTLEGAKLGSYDIITLYHVLEHLPDPSACMAKVSSAMNPGGLLIVEVPNIASLNGRREKGRWWYAGVGHIFHFTPKTISRLLEKSGFKVAKIIPEGGFLAGKVGGAERAAAKYYILLKPAVLAYRALSRAFKLSDAMIVVARKK